MDTSCLNGHTIISDVFKHCFHIVTDGIADQANITPAFIYTRAHANIPHLLNLVAIINVKRTRVQLSAGGTRALRGSSQPSHYIKQTSLQAGNMTALH